MGRVIHAYRTHSWHGHPLPQATVAGWFQLNQAQLSRIENGQPVMDLTKLIQWAHTLRIPPDLLWFKLPSQRRKAEAAPVFTVNERAVAAEPASVGGWEDVKRSQFLKIGVSGLGAVAATPLAGIDSGPPPIPHRVGSAEIGQIRDAARAFAGWAHSYGGAVVRETITSQLKWSADLLKTGCSAALRPELFAAVGELGTVAGSTAFDAQEHPDARSMFTFALSCIEESGDWHLRAKVLSLMARQAVWCEDADTGLTYVELAMVRSDRLSGPEQAMLGCARARALAKLGRVQETLAAVGIADEAFSRGTSEDNPVWMRYYDNAQHLGDTGHALFDLALSGHANEGADRLAGAVAGHTDAYTRSRAFSLTKLASLTMATGDPLEAVALGHRSLDLADQLRSPRALDYLRELHTVAGPRARTAEVAELRRRIRTEIDAA